MLHGDIAGWKGTKKPLLCPFLKSNSISNFVVSQKILIFGDIYYKDHVNEYFDGT